MAKNTAPPASFEPGSTNARAVRNPDQTAKGPKDTAGRGVDQTANATDKAADAATDQAVNTAASTETATDKPKRKRVRVGKHKA